MPEQTKESTESKGSREVTGSGRGKASCERGSEGRRRRGCFEPEADVAAEEQDGTPSKSTEGSAEEVVADSDERK